MQARLQAQDARAEEMRSATEEATRPLLRQLDALQTQMASNSRTWQTVEDKYDPGCRLQRFPAFPAFSGPVRWSRPLTAA